MADAPGDDAGPVRPARRKRRRLSRSGEFDRVYREGRSHAGRHLILYAFPRGTGDEGPRLGISVGRRVGGAVERNRVKRALRESFWACAEPLPDTHDFVIVARPEAAKLTADEGEPGLRAALRELMDEAGLTGDADR